MTAGLARRDGPGTASAPEAPVAVVVAASDLATREAAAWDRLFARTPHPNPHYGRQVLEAHRAHGLAPADLRLLVVRHAGRLAALLPFLPGRGLTRPFTSPYVTATAPLLAGDAPEGTLAAFVAGLVRASHGRPWRWPLLPVEDPAGRGLLAALEAGGWALGTVGGFARPVFQRRADLAAALAASPARERLKDLRRRRRRLDERGAVALEAATEGPALALALEAFLALEARGWKGARGTALASRPASAAFARALFAPEAGGPVGRRIDLLRLDGRPLAGSLALVAGGTATLLKTAYDEAARALAPGVLLEAEIVRAVHEAGFAERLDSASLPGSVLEALYPDRAAIREIVAVPPAHPWAGAARTGLVAGLRLERGATARLKGLAGRLAPPRVRPRPG